MRVAFTCSSTEHVESLWISDSLWIPSRSPHFPSLLALKFKRRPSAGSGLGTPGIIVVRSSLLNFSPGNDLRTRRVGTSTMHKGSASRDG